MQIDEQARGAPYLQQILPGALARGTDQRNSLLTTVDENESLIFVCGNFSGPLDGCAVIVIALLPKCNSLVALLVDGPYGRRGASFL